MRFAIVALEITCREDLCLVGEVISHPGAGTTNVPALTFEGLTTVTEKFTEKLRLLSYALYLSDIAASVGFRLAVMHPERVTAMIVQNGAPMLKP